MVTQLRKNLDRLRTSLKEIGRRYETSDYADLAGGALDQSTGELEIEGMPAYYSAYSVETSADGDVHFTIDLFSELPTWFGIKPSHEFWMRPDGSVYYPK